tara:strand:+ start:5297 stop:5617 length:321 start_codon:yes stop_codon:yes gene_type:complete
MANNFNDSQASLTNANLTDIFTASNKSLVIAGTISNTTTTSILVSLKKYDNSASAGKFIFENVPLPTGSSIELPKIVLQTSDKIQAQSDNASGHADVHLQLLTDVS